MANGLRGWRLGSSTLDDKWWPGAGAHTRSVCISVPAGGGSARPWDPYRRELDGVDPRVLCLGTNVRRMSLLASGDNANDTASNWVIIKRKVFMVNVGGCSCDF
jgi:hypothetical protein